MDVTLLLSPSPPYPKTQKAQQEMILAAATSTFCPIPTSPTMRPHSLSDRISSFDLSTITHENKRRCECYDLHRQLVPYKEAWNWQKEIVRQKRKLIAENEECPDTLIVLQHHPVYTMGTGSSLEYFNFDVNEAPFEVYRTERGGEVTYHGPGQLVMYPILNLRNHEMDLHWYLRALEEVVIRVLDSAFSIKASRVEGLTGVWVGDHKLAAIGIKVSQWITSHGLALNITTDMRPFDSIVPCGIRNRKVGSIKRLLGETQLSNRDENADIPGFDDVRLIDITYNSLIKEFTEVFQLDIHQKTIKNIGFVGEET